MKDESRMVGTRGWGQWGVREGLVLNSISIMLRSEFLLCCYIEEGLWIAVVSYAFLNAGEED